MLDKMQKTFGSLVRQLRRERNFTVRYFAEAAGISKTYLSSMELGSVAPPAEDKIVRIAELLDQNKDEMLALAGKVSSDVLQIIFQKPKETAALIRRLNHAPASKRNAVAGAAAPVQNTEPLLEFYPLEAISRENHTAVIGESGSGKSVLTKFLIKTYFQDAQVLAYDSDAAPHDWQGFEVIGRRGDYAGIAQGMSADLAELNRRTVQHGEGAEAGTEIVRVIEEYPSTAAELAECGIESVPADIGLVWLRKLLRRGRKYRMKVFAVAQEFEVASWKITGEGGLRRAFTVLYLGATAYQALSQVKDTRYRDRLRAYFDSVPYCCLVDVKGRFYPAQLPDLTP